MKPRIPVALTMFAVALSACETTGDPQRGGLFGWSETKARQRQAEKQAAVTDAETDLARESGRTAALDRRRKTTEGQIAGVQSEHARAEHQLGVQRDELLARTAHLEDDCPTPASASRARVRGREFYKKINTIEANRSLTVTQRAELLRWVGAEIEAARKQFSR